MQHLTCRQYDAASFIQKAIQTGHDGRTRNQRRLLQLTDPTIADSANQRALNIAEALAASLRAKLHLLAEQLGHAFGFSGISLRNASNSFICCHGVHTDISCGRQVLEQFLIDAIVRISRINGHHVANQVIHFSTSIAGNERIR